MALLNLVAGWCWFLPVRTPSAGVMTVLSWNVTFPELWPMGAIAPFCESCHAHAVCFFAGADVRSKTPLGRTALHVAAVMGRCECIELLVSFGARALDPDCEGQTAVRLAQRWGQKESKRALMRVPRQLAGARPQHQDGAVQQAHGQPA